MLHADDTPHVIALGVALAMFVTFLPIVGIQTVVAIGLAALFRANKAVCVPIVWITNPATMLPIFYGCFKLGAVVMPETATSDEADLRRLVEFAKTSSIFESEFWAGLAPLMLSLGIDLWVGCAIVGATLGLLSYFVTRWGVSSYRERRRQRLLRRSLFRSQFQKAKLARRSEPA